MWRKQDSVYLGATVVAGVIAACAVFAHVPATSTHIAAASIDGGALPEPMIAPAPPPPRHVDVALVPVDVTRVVVRTIERVVHVAATPTSAATPTPSVRPTPRPTVAPKTQPMEHASEKKPPKVKKKPGDASAPR